MLLKITNQCHEGCSHCMENSLPTEPHMSWDTLNDAIAFMNFNKVSVVAVSGGEPTCDPEWDAKFIHMYNQMPDTIFTIQSNGSWIFDINKTKIISNMLNNLDRLKCIQISSNKKYYPNYEAIMAKKSEFESLSSKILFVTDWQGTITGLQRLGRAADLTNESFDRAPGCSPVFSRAHQLDKLVAQAGLKLDDINLDQFLKMLEMSSYVCKPLINNTGTVHASESPYCVKIGDVSEMRNMTQNELRMKSKDMLMALHNKPMCDRCGQVKNLKGRVPDKVLETKLFKNI